MTTRVERPARKTVKAVSGPAGKSPKARTGTGRADQIVQVVTPATDPRQPAKKIRHFLVDQDQHDAAFGHAGALNMRMSEVITQVLRGYGESFDLKNAAPAVSGTVPSAVRATLSRLETNGLNEDLSGYLAALTDAGWPMASLALAMPKHDVAERHVPFIGPDGKEQVEVRVAKHAHPTRQAIQLRVKSARAKGLLAPDGAPVPQAPAGPQVPRAAKGSGGNKKNAMVRMSDADYGRAKARATHEGLPMTVVVRRGLNEFLATPISHG